MLELTLQYYKKKNEALWWSGGGIEQTGPAWNLNRKCQATTKVFLMLPGPPAHAQLEKAIQSNSGHGKNEY